MPLIAEERRELTEHDENEMLAEFWDVVREVRGEAKAKAAADSKKVAATAEQAEQMEPMASVARGVVSFAETTAENIQRRLAKNPKWSMGRAEAEAIANRLARVVMLAWREIDLAKRGWTDRFEAVHGPLDELAKATAKIQRRNAKA
jgi:hypothetical protein